MKRQFVILLSLAALITFSGCAKIFHTPDYRAIASKENTIAIVPPKVSIAAQRKVDSESIVEQQKTESINFQKEMYSWLLKRKMQGKMTVELQDVETTNAILSQFEDQIFTPNELCDILRVDGVLTSNFSMSKPMSTGAAIAMTVLVGFAGATNKAVVSLSVHDFESNKMIWNYNHKLSTTFGSSNQLIDNLMRQASRKMPYFTPQY